VQNLGSIGACLGVAQIDQSFEILTGAKNPQVGGHEISEIENFFLMPKHLKMHESSRSVVISKKNFLSKIDFLGLRIFSIIEHFQSNEIPLMELVKQTFTDSYETLYQ